VKEHFLCCADYGTGGIWLYIVATRPDDIVASYPELTVIDLRPAWMTDEYEPGDDMTFDIDQPPTGWLKLLVDSRKED
jgi:hypothetical protein